MYSESVDFLLGMMFREIFSFIADLLPSIYQGISHQNPPKTYALHSRHRCMKDDGSDISEELKCLDSMMNFKYRLSSSSKSSSLASSCSVFIMSDVSLTPEAHIRDDCTPVLAIHAGEQQGQFKEHVPFAGAGFFKDLALSSQARDGFIGHCDRNSSQLLKELIEYDRTIEALRSGAYSKLSDFPTCCLPG